jgi:hypothetical protein
MRDEREYTSLKGIEYLGRKLGRCKTGLDFE